MADKNSQSYKDAEALFEYMVKGKNAASVRKASEKGHKAIETPDVPTILKEIEADTDVRLTHEQILLVMESLSKLTTEQKNIINAYFKRVPYSHPRWWHY